MCVHFDGKSRENDGIFKKRLTTDHLSPEPFFVSDDLSFPKSASPDIRPFRLLRVLRRRLSVVKNTVFTI